MTGLGAGRRSLALAMAGSALVLGLAGCGGTTSTPPVSTAPSATPSPSASTGSPGVTATDTASSSPSPSASGTPSGSPSSSVSESASVSVSPSGSPSTSAPVDTTAAAKAALTLWSKAPLDLANPAAGYSWAGVPWASAPMTPALRDRLFALRKNNWFDDSHCGEDYLVGGQVSMPSAPTVRSATASPDGTVLVVVRRPQSPPPATRDLGVVMTYVNGTWLASDLRVGTGPTSSVFSSAPRC